MSRFFRLALFVVFFAAFFSISSEHAFAAVRTWDGGGGADTAWSTCANWSSDTCPTTADVATFASTSLTNTTITSAVSVLGIDMDALYTGTVTQSAGAGNTITVGSSDFILDGGTFTGGDATIDLNDAYTQTAGTFTSTSGSLQIAGAFTHTAGGTFTHNSGTVVFDGSAQATWNFATTEEFNNFEINNSFTNAHGLNISSGDTLNVNGTLTLTDGSTGSTGTLAAKGSTVTIGPAWGHGSLTSGTITINGSGVQTVTIAPQSSTIEVADQFTINNASATVSGTGTVGTIYFDKVTVQAGVLAFTGYNPVFAEAVTVSGGTMSFTDGDPTFDSTFALSSGAFTGGTGTDDFNGAITISGGTFTATSGTTTISAVGFTHTAGGTFTHNSGTVVFDGSAAATWNVATSEEFNNFEINNSFTNAHALIISTGDTLNINGTLTLTDGSVGTGTLAAKGSTVTIGAAWGHGSLTGGTITINGSGVQTVTIAPQSSAIEVADQFTINNASATVSGTGTVGTIYFDKVTVQAGVLNLSGGYSSTFAEAFAVSGGTFTAGSGTVDHDGAITFSSGTYTATSGTTTLSAGFTHSGGTFTHNSGTFNLDPGGGITLDLNSTIFYHVSTNTTVDGSIYTLGTSDSMYVAGNLTQNNGRFGTASATIYLSGNLSLGSGFDTAPSGPNLSFIGSGTQSVTATGVEASFDFDTTVNKSSGEVQLLSNWTFNNSGQDLVIQEGTFDVNGYNLAVQGAGTETLIVETGGNLQLQGGETITGDSASYPQLNSGSTVTYDGTSGPYTMKDYTYHHLVINGGASSVFTQAANESYGGNVTITQGILSQGGFTTTVTGTFSNSGTLRRLQTETFTGTMDIDSGTVEYVGDGDAQETVTITDFGTTDYYHLKINDTNVTKDIFALGGTTVVAGTLQVSSAEFQQGTNAVTAAAITVDGGTLTGGSSSITVSGAVTISSGTLTSTSNTLTVSGGWTHTAGGTFTHNSGTVAFTGNSATVDVSTSETFSALTINKTDGQTLTIASGDTLIATGVLTLTNGTWATGSVQAQGNVAVPSTWDAGGSGTLEFAGSGTQTFDLTGAEAAFDNPVNVNKSGGSLTLASAYTLDHANADFTVTLGTFSTGNYAMTTSSGSDIAVNAGIFNAGSSTLTLAGAVTVAGGTMNGNTSTGTISGAFLLSSGAYNGNTSTPTFSGGLTISGGTFTSTSNTLTVSGAWTHTAGGTFTHNSGTVAFTGNSATVDVSISETFSALTINKTDGQTLTIASGDTLSAAGTLTLTDGAFATGTLNPQANIVVGALWDAAGSGTVNVTGSGTQTLDLSAGAGLLDNPLTINKAGGSFTLASAYTLDHANADLTLTLGTFSTGDYTVTTSSGSDIAINGGTFNAGASTMTINGLLTVAGGTYNAQNSTPTYAGGFVLSSGAYTGSGNGDAFTGTLTISGGTFTASDATTSIASTFTHTAGGTFTHNGGTVSFTGNAATIDVATSDTFSSLTLNKNNTQTLTVSSGDSLIVTGTLTLTNGAVGTGTLEAQGGVSVGSGYDGGNASLKFSGTNAQTFTLTGATGKYDGDIEIAKSSNTVSLGSDLVMDASGQDLTITIGTLSTTGTNYGLTVAGNVAVNGGTLSFNGSTVDLNGNLTIGGGTLSMGTATITLAGDVTYTSGTMTEGTSVTTLDGGNQQISGATTWGSLAKTASSSATLTFPADTVTTISGTLTLAGTSSSSLLSLRSSSAGTRATLTPTTVTTPSYLDIRDISITKATNCPSSTSGCVNSGNNQGWTFQSGGRTIVETPKTLTLESPNGDETYEAGDAVAIRWSSTGSVPTIRILFSPDDGASWSILAGPMNNASPYTWEIEEDPTDTALLRVEGFDGLSAYVYAVSADTFTIRDGETVEEMDEEEVIEETEEDVSEEQIDTLAEIEERVSALPEEVAIHGLVKLADDGNASTQSDSVIYYIGADGYRHAFPNEAVYFSWFCDFSSVQVVGLDVLSELRFGPNITYRPGLRLVKFQSSPKTYAVDRFGVLRWITSEEVASLLYGDDWMHKIDDISDAFFSNYTFGDPIEDEHQFDPDAQMSGVVFPSDSLVIPGYTGSSGGLFSCQE